MIIYRDFKKQEKIAIMPSTSLKRQMPKNDFSLKPCSLLLDKNKKFKKRSLSINSESSILSPFNHDQSMNLSEFAADLSLNNSKLNKNILQFEVIFYIIF